VHSRAPAIDQKLPNACLWRPAASGRPAGVMCCVCTPPGPLALSPRINVNPHIDLNITTNPAAPQTRCQLRGDLAAETMLAPARGAQASALRSSRPQTRVFAVSSPAASMMRSRAPVQSAAAKCLARARFTGLPAQPLPGRPAVPIGASWFRLCIVSVLILAA